MPIDRAASGGFTAGAAIYERVRPSYPRAAVAALARNLALRPNTVTLDLAAGTGKLTRMLTGTTARIVAAEPVAAMRQQFAQHLSEVPILGAVAEALPFKHGSINAVVVGQAFHWFDHDQALAEIHRVLRVRGRLGLIWNMRDLSVDWLAQADAITDAYQGLAPKARSGEWRAAFSRSALFSPLREETFRYQLEKTHQEVVDLYSSVSFISLLAPDELLRFRERLTTLLATHPSTRDEAVLHVPYNTRVFWCERR